MTARDASPLALPDSPPSALREACGVSDVSPLALREAYGVSDVTRRVVRKGGAERRGTF